MLSRNMEVRANSFWKVWDLERNNCSEVELKLFFVSGEVIRKLRYVLTQLGSTAIREEKTQAESSASKGRDIHLRGER